MEKISAFIICSIAVILISCNGSEANKSDRLKESEEKAENIQSYEEPLDVDFLKNYEIFVNEEISKIEKSSIAETVAKSVKSMEEFINKYGDPNAMDMTAEGQKKFNEIKDKYESAVKKISGKIN